jgi:RNA polymerase sigma factor (sigma-70 family)
MANGPTVSEPQSDHTLVRYVREGDPSAAQTLFQRYAQRLRAIVASRCRPEFASRFDPEDVVQSVFRILYQGIQSRDYDVPKGGELWSLLSVLALNKLRDQVAHHRAAKRSVYRTTDCSETPLEQQLCSEDETENMLQLIVQEFLDGLPASDRDVIALRMTGHTITQIAERTGRPLRSVERVLHKVRDGLMAVFRK